MFIVEFITKYWLEFLFSLIITGCGIALKKIWSMYKKEKAEAERNRIQAETGKVSEQFQKDNEAVQLQINQMQTEMTALKRGLLSIQGKLFRQECERLLDESHEITLDEYQQLMEDHDIYNSLGGNHNGDNLYSLVEKKVTNLLLVK